MQLEGIFQSEAEAVQVLVLKLVLQLRQVGSIGAGMGQRRPGFQISEGVWRRGRGSRVGSKGSLITWAGPRVAVG